MSQHTEASGGARRVRKARIAELEEEAARLRRHVIQLREALAPFAAMGSTPFGAGGFEMQNARKAMAETAGSV